MATDLTKLSSDQVLDLINTDNGSELTFEHISFGIPTLLEADPAERNTTLTVSAAPNGGYTGEVEVKYNRLPLSGFEQYGAPALVIPPEGTMSDIMQAFNDFYDANLVLLEDIKYDLQMPVIDYVGSDIVLEAANESLAYMGAITVNVKWESTELSEAIANGMLSGLSWPVVEGPSLLGQNEIIGTVVLNVATNGYNFFSHRDPDGTYVFGSNTGSIWKRYDSSSGVVNNLKIDSRIGNGFRPLYLASDNTYRVVGNNNAPYHELLRLDSETGSYIDVIPLVGSRSVRPLSSSGGQCVYTVIDNFAYYLSNNNLWSKVDLETGECASLADIPASRGGSVQSNNSLIASLGDKIYIYIDMVNNSVVSELLCYDIPSDTWSYLETPPNRLTNGHFFIIRNEVYFLAINVVSSIMYRYTPTTNTWFTYTDVKSADHRLGLWYESDEGIYQIGGYIGTIAQDTVNLIT